MNDFTVFPLNNYKMKYAGISISVISLILLVINSFVHNLNFHSNISEVQHQNILFWGFVMGLYLLTFSKEKIDDDRVKRIRSKALQISFGLLSSVLLAITFIGSYDNTFQSFETIQILSIVAGSLLIYQIIFNLGIYHDSSFIYSDNTVRENKRRNKRFYLIYILVSLITLTLIIIF